MFDGEKIFAMKKNGNKIFASKKSSFFIGEILNVEKRMWLKIAKKNNRNERKKHKKWEEKKINKKIGTAWFSVLKHLNLIFIRISFWNLSNQ